jgi:hypothetical protein
MREWTRMGLAASLFLVACAGGEERPASQDEASEGRMAIAVPDSPPPADTAVIRAAPLAGPGDTVASGTVRELGALPLPQLVVQGSDASSAPVAVRGPAADEIRNLIGAEVRVWGRPTDNQPPTPPRAIEVTGYDVISIGGETPIVGTLELHDATFFLRSADSVALAAVPGPFAELVGAKIWVVGPLRGSALTVQAYGVIRQPDH